MATVTCGKLLLFQETKLANALKAGYVRFAANKFGPNYQLTPPQMKVGPRNYRIHSQRCVRRVLHLKLKASGETKFGLKIFTPAFYILPLWNPLDIFCCVGYNLQFTILIYKSTHLLPDANCSNSNLHFHVRKSLFKHSLPFFYFQLRNFEIRKNTVLKSIVLLFDLSVMHLQLLL